MKFCPRCKLEFSSDVEFCSACHVELKPVAFCARCNEMFKLEGELCPECGGPLEPLAEDVARESANPPPAASRYRYLLAVILLLVGGISAPFYFGLLMSLTLIFIFTFIGYFIGLALDSLNPGLGKAPEPDEGLDENLKDAERALEEDNTVRCVMCGEALNLYTREGIVEGRSQPWRLFCAYCGHELEAGEL
jgi:hypothetical protein